MVMASVAAAPILSKHNDIEDLPEDGAMEWLDDLQGSLMNFVKNDMIGYIVPSEEMEDKMDAGQVNVYLKTADQPEVISYEVAWAESHESSGK